MRKSLSTRNRGKKTPKAFIAIFAIAIVAAILVWVALPVSGAWRRLIGFLMIPGISMVGIVVYNFVRRR